MQSAGSSTAVCSSTGSRAYFRHDRRRRFAELSRLAYHTLRDYLGAALGEYDAAPGAIACVQSLARSPTGIRTYTCS